MTLESLKTVIRVRDFESARDFYTRVLGLLPVEEWSEPEGRGCIFPVGGGLFEIYGMTARDPRFHESFSRPIGSDKIDIQIETADVDSWATRLRGVWPYRGPETLPWGQRWIQLRDPDGLLIALYERAKG